MKVSKFMKPVTGRMQRTGRDPASYRAARREAAKRAYREAKRNK